MPERSTLATYLYFGFLPRVERGFERHAWARVLAAEVAREADEEREHALARGVAAFRAACRAALEPAGRGPLVVPLSGGIDSRLILGVLVELGLAERMVAVTFGIPGTLDFDLAPRVARAAGVRHEAIDLTARGLARAALLDTARRAPWTFLFEVAYNHLVFERFGREATYWSGSQANSLAGEDADALFPDWASACRRFAAETRFSTTIDLTPPDFRAESALPAQPLLADSCLNAYEQLHMAVRNPSRNDPAQLPPGFDVRTPFLRPEWVDFSLRLPRAVRRGGRFYHELAARAVPRLFALPTKTYLGWPVNAPDWRVQLSRARLKAVRTLVRRFPRAAAPPDPKLNYVDFDRELRTATPLGALVRDSLERLARRGVVDWLEPLELWQRHARRRANLGAALALLASLELVLTADESPAA